MSPAEARLKEVPSTMTEAEWEQRVNLAAAYRLVAHYGWEGLGERISLRCFTSDPSISSSLKFLRKTPWAREKVESLYLFMLRDIRRQQPPVA